MFTLRCEKYLDAPFPFIPASYSVVHAASYYVRHEQYFNGAFGPPIPPNSLTSKEDGKWRTVIEVHTGTEAFNIYVSDEEPVHKVYVMNHHGKTIDTIG